MSAITALIGSPLGDRWVAQAGEIEEVAMGAVARTADVRSPPAMKAVPGGRVDAVGCNQKQTTGVAGALSILSLYYAYTQFQGVVTDGGPQWHSLFGFEKIARDWADIILCVVVTFTVMVAFEKSRDWVRYVALALVGLAASRILGAGDATVQWLGEAITVPEQLMLGVAGTNIVLMTVDFIHRKWTGLAKPVPNARQVSWGYAVKAGAIRYGALLGVLSLAYFVYQYSKLYSGLPRNTEGYYLNWRIAVTFVWAGFIALGLPYCILTIKYRSKLSEDRGDPAMNLLLVLRTFWRDGGKAAWHLLEIRRVRAALLDWAVKFFWAPLMVTFLFNECGNFHGGLNGSLPVFQREGFWGGIGHVINAFMSTRDEKFLEDTYHVLYHGLFLVDVTLALLGYLSASRWLGTKSKSAESTALGWMAALACYPPFNNVTGILVPYDANHGPPYSVLTGIMFHHFLMLTTLGLFFIYVWATVAFGLRFSNLTHRGIIARGPYAWIRHPAYATKNLAWWTESINNFGSPWQFAYIFGCNLLYVTRALTEERHLSLFADYREYAKKVKWRFFPGIY